VPGRTIFTSYIIAACAAQIVKKMPPQPPRAHLQKAKRRATPLRRLQQPMQRPPVQIVVRALMIVIAIRTGAITAAARRAKLERVASLVTTRPVATSPAKAAATVRVTAAVRIVAPIAVAVPETADVATSFAVSRKSLQLPRRSAPVRTRIRRSRNSRLSRPAWKSAVMDRGHADAERASGS
jgi:hypothetical protein